MPENGEEKKMKKFLVLIVFAMIIIFALSCGNEKRVAAMSLLNYRCRHYRRQAFNQGSWEGLKVCRREKHNS